MSDARYAPGQEVELSTGEVGVLYARAWGTFKTRRIGEVRWFFLPDVRGAQGLVVHGQPRTIDEDTIARGGALRQGAWPGPHYRLSDQHRQAVYVAHMRRLPLPLPVEA